MTNALWITLIGMGLVFIAILLLWGGMALLVRITTEKATSEPGGEAADAEENPMAEAETKAAPANMEPQKRRAAAAAAAVAVALRKSALREDGARPDGSRTGNALSAWQSVNRASQVNQAVNLSRKKVAR